MAPLISEASLYHWLPVAEEEVSVTLPPSQKVVVLPALIVGLDGAAATIETAVLPELAIIVHPRVRVLMVTFVVPAEARFGVLNDPVLLLLTVIDTSDAICAFAPVSA